MSNLLEIKEMASNEFDSFLANIHTNNPELILKYQLTKDMKNEFIEAAIKQFWTQKPWDTKEVIEFTVERHKQLNQTRRS